MIDVLLILAVLSGCAGAWRGNRTSMALIASAGTVGALTLVGVPFVWPVWMLIDMAVIAVIVWRPMKYSDCPIVALFIPAWGLYPSVAGGDQQASDLISLVVAVQFLLSAPWRLMLHKLRLRPADLTVEGEFLKVRHAPA